jgi:16S rRNA C967 or C1407 C5-methylase (RsmB/RsmF family)
MLPCTLISLDSLLFRSYRNAAHFPTNNTHIVIANDANPQRAYMLTHQLRRLMHSNPVVMVSAANAQSFPALPNHRYDRILADVPCSGDGTSRKNIGVWKSWTALGGLALHPLQIDIAWHGLAQLLAVGGYLVYSTCSLNPIENEAVVAELLRRGRGQVELLPIHDLLHGFKTRPGWMTWKIMCEEKSRKEIKDHQKKRNDKMKQRRKEWTDATTVSTDDITVLDTNGYTDTTTNESNPQHNEAGSLDQGDETLIDKESEAPNTNGHVSESVDSTSANNTDGDALPSETAPGGEPASTRNNEQVDVDDTPPVRIFQPASLQDEDLDALATEADFHMFTSFQDVPEHLQRRVRASCFPPTGNENFPLSRCVRCLPHDNDTGGFFVALLRKTGPISAADRKLAAATTNDEEEEAEPNGKKLKLSPEANQTSEVPVIPEESNDMEINKDNDDDDDVPVVMDEDNKPYRGRGGPRGSTKDDERFVSVPDSILAPLVEYYGLSSSSTFRPELLMTRAHGESKVIHYVSPSIKQLIDRGIQDRVQMINTGLKALVKNNRDCDTTHRIAQEGVHFIAQHMSKRKVVANREDFERCLLTDPTPLSRFSSDFQEVARPFTVGSFVVLLQGYETQPDRRLILTMWRCRGDNVNGLVAKVEQDLMRSRLQMVDEEPTAAAALVPAVVDAHST